MAGESWLPDRAAARHLLKVLRLSNGQELELLDGRGAVAVGTLCVTGTRAEVRVESVRHHEAPRPRLRCWLPPMRSGWS